MTPDLPTPYSSPPFIPNLMAIKKSISTLEVSQIVNEYHAYFPDWQVVQGDTLLRTRGPIGQSIWFDRLRTGSYRPTARIHILAAPDEHDEVIVLPQFLGLKNREIRYEDHRNRLSDVLDALRAEIKPSLSASLDAAVVADLLSERSIGRPVHCYALACLYAALDRSLDAKRWITEYHAAVRNINLPETPIDIYRSNFLTRLLDWIDKSIHHAKLNSIIDCQTARLIAWVRKRGRIPNVS